MSDLRLVHLQFRSPQNASEAAQKAAWERAHAIPQWPGLVWKIWTHEPAGDRGGGIYLFHDAASAAAHLNSPIVAAMKAIPGISDFHATLKR